MQGRRRGAGLCFACWIEKGKEGRRWWIVNGDWWYWFTYFTFYFIFVGKLLLFTSSSRSIRSDQKEWKVKKKIVNNKKKKKLNAGNVWGGGGGSFLQFPSNNKGEKMCNVKAYFRNSNSPLSRDFKFWIFPIIPHHSLVNLVRPVGSVGYVFLIFPTLFFSFFL